MVNCLSVSAAEKSFTMKALRKALLKTMMLPLNTGLNQTEII